MKNLKNILISPPILGGVRGGKSGFTLVELIVVITILVILGTIAFVNLGNFSNSARDSARISNTTNISKGLELTLIKNSTVPPPTDNTITLSASGVIIGYQGYAGATVLSQINMSDAKDPTDHQYYTYSTNLTRTKYQLLSLLEDPSTLTSLIPQTYAGYETRTPTTKGSSLGILLGNTGSSLNQPIQELYNATSFTGVDIAITATGYRAYFTDTDTLEGTGTILQNLQISYTYGAGFNSPTSCPTGFIPVPGDSEFNQPGFCVAKYEMNYSDADVPDSGTTAGTKDGTDGVQSWNTMNYNNTKTAVSIPNKYPIANINQAHAIAECQKLGPGYHLITNNEWMTIARNIEAQNDNWSNGVVGSGGIYRGIMGEANSATTLGCQTSVSAGLGSRPYAARSLSTDTVKFGTTKGSDCDSKRQLRLSNNQIIWDISGNIWEHVNGANTIDGVNYATMNGNACGAQADNNWNSFTYNATTDTVRQCNFSNGYTYANMGPKTPNLNTSNGIGRIWAYGTSSPTNQAFLRGGSLYDVTSVGIFTLYSAYNTSLAGRHVGFRCAR